MKGKKGNTVDKEVPAALIQATMDANGSKDERLFECEEAQQDGEMSQTITASLGIESVLRKHKEFMASRLMLSILPQAQGQEAADIQPTI